MWKAYYIDTIICNSFFINQNETACTDAWSQMLTPNTYCQTWFKISYQISFHFTFSISLSYQNAAARMLTRTRKFDHISPVLRNLHWLPIRQRIKYKLLLLTWKALHGMAPPYIQDLLKEYAPTRNLRSSSQHLLDSARTSTSYGDRAFSAVAPALWNALPTDIRESQSIDTFCSKLKTHLFSSAFN